MNNISKKEMKVEEDKEFIRSSSSSLKFSNISKINQLHSFISEYKNVLEQFINYLWNLRENEKIPSLLSKEETSKVNTWLTARAVQACAKQASAIIRGTRTLQKRKLYQINKFNKQGMFKKARKLKKIYDKAKISKPIINEVCPELDSRFVKLELDNKTTFDGWITLTCLGNDLKIILPFKRTKHFNKMLEIGKIKQGVRISKNKITFNFSLITPKLKTEGNIVGLDKGIKNVYSLSDKQESNDDIHGWNLDKIIKKMNKQKKGSKAFQKSKTHRKNYINWSLNQIDFSNIKTLNIEKIRNMRKGKRTSNYLARWTYTEINDKLKNLALENGVQTKELSPVYTSQRCSICGWTCKANRKGKKFVCVKCNKVLDADYNASLNISFDLPEITKVKQLKHINNRGFYWNVLGEEPIVSLVQKVLE